MYFCEDDYLHTPDAVQVLRALEPHPEASYVALYGATPDYANPREFPHGYRYPDGWPVQPEIEADGYRFVQAVSTTSTFGARLGALRADYPIFRQAMFPFRHRFLDHETCVIYQGRRPYTPMEHLTGPSHEFEPTPRGVARAAFLVPFRVGLTLRSRRNAHDPHLLEPYADRYHAELTSAWNELTSATAGDVTLLMYPGQLAHQRLADASAAWLEANPSAPAGARRGVAENRDGVLRAVRAQECDAARPSVE